jgi:hypothetical protein
MVPAAKETTSACACYHASLECLTASYSTSISLCAPSTSILFFYSIDFRFHLTSADMYAFAQVAIYGKRYCSAAKATWDLFKSSGMGMKTPLKVHLPSVYYFILF